MERMLLLFGRYDRALPMEVLQKVIARLRAGEPLSIMRDFYDIVGRKDSVFEESFSSMAIPSALPQAIKDTTELNWLIADLAERMCNDGFASRCVRDVGMTRAIWAGDQAMSKRIGKVTFKRPKPTLLEKIRTLFGLGAL
jgi:hypothetical protein